MLATVATSGLYSDLSGTPMLAAVATSGLYSDLSGTPSLASVATSGLYSDLSGTPTIPYYLLLSGDSGTGNVELLMDTIDFVGNGPLNTAISRVGNVVSVTSNVDYATTSDVGVASFSSSNFDVSAGGQVTLKTGGITNASLANANITIGNTTVNLGETTTAFAGLTSVQVGNIKIHNNNTIENPALNGNISLKTNGAGIIDANDTRITNVSDPINAHDVANRSYVDAVAAGLHVHAPAAVAVEGNLATLTGGSVTYYNGVGNDGVDATITLGTAITAIDGQTLGTATLPTNSRILIKDQANKAQNGIYTINAGGTVLTRAVDFNTPTLIHGGDFIFVEYGTTNADTGWVCTTNSPVTVGTTDIVFVQFSGAGSYTANTSAGLQLLGTQFNAKVDGNSNPTTAFDGNGNIYVPAGAAFTTPNIGAATGTSVSVSAGVTANTLTANLTLAVTGNANVGNLGTVGLINATGTITGGNISTGGTVTATGNGTFGNISTTGSGGNITGANVISANTLTATGNVNAVNFVGNTAQIYTGIITTSNPAVNVSQTWNNASATFTGILENVTDTNSAAGSLLMDLQVGGTSKFSVSKIGNVTVGNLSTGGLSANSFSVNSLAIGNTAINANTVTTSSITANQTIATFQLTGSNVTGVEFLVKGYDSPGAKYSVATVLAVTDGNISANNVDYTIYSTVRLGTSTGSLAVNIDAGNVALQVTPTSSNSTVWTTQIRTI
jgi:hypothetical protein